MKREDVAVASGLNLVREVVDRNRGNYDASKPSVLCLHRGVFNADVAALGRLATKYNWIKLSVPILHFAQPWIAPEAQGQASYVNYLCEPYEAGWRLSAIQAEVLLATLRSEMRLSAVLAANWDYWTDEGIRRACKKLGIPFLVLLREHYFCRRDRDDLAVYYASCPVAPCVDGVAVAGAITRDIYVELNVLAAAQTFVTGFPRLDPWLEPHRRQADHGVRDTIVLVTYTDGYHCDDHFFECLRVFAAASWEHRGKGIRFLVKAKTKEDQDVVEAALRSSPSHDLEIVYAPYIPEIYERAIGVIGFNSLALLEALLAPVHIVVPHWGKTIIDPDDQILSPIDPRVQQEVKFVSGPRSLSAAIAEMILAGPNRTADIKLRTEIFQDSIYFTPGAQAALRVQDFVDKFVNRGDPKGTIHSDEVAGLNPIRELRDP